MADDPSIKGMWIVPTYANPAGSVTTQEVAARLASMETAAPDFKIFWDNAYAFHHLTADEAKSADILTIAAASGHPHRPVMFASTSKITHAGAGVAFLAGSVETVKWYIGHLGQGAIGPDKLNQLRHAQFFGSPEGVREHMRKHREIIALCDLEELPYATVASILQVPVGTVRSRLHRARALLSIRLASMEIVDLHDELPMAQRGLS